MSDERPDAYEIVEQHWPYDGPYSDEHTRQAALMIERLVRYLNNATGKRDAITYASTAGEVLVSLWGASASTDQLLRQLGEYTVRLAADLRTYDDRHDRPVAQTAGEIGAELRDARDALTDLVLCLQRVASAVNHIGRREPGPAS